MAEKKGNIIVIKKKKGGGHAAPHGGAWKVAYADFVTAMMAFFMVMWLMGSDDETKAEITHYFNHPNTQWKNGGDPDSKMARPLGEKPGSGDEILTGLGGAVPDDMVTNPQRPVSEQMQANQELNDRVQSAMEDIVYGMDVNIDSLRFSIQEDYLFKPGTTQFAPSAEKYLGKVGDILRGYKGYVQINGHLDSATSRVPAGSSGSNYEFSTAQAVSVMRYFVNESWITEDRVSPRGMGPENLYSNGEAPESHAKNNRIEFIFSRKKSL